jgi:MFS transporter, DHA1 family, inner membrane transport protein
MASWSRFRGTIKVKLMNTRTQAAFWERVGPYDARRNKIALGMWIVLLLSYVMNTMDRQVFSVLATDVRGALGLKVPQVGLAATIFTLGIGLGGIPTGYLMYRVKRNNVACTGIAVFSLATLLTAFSQGFGDLLLYRFASGVGESMQLTALLAIGATYFVNHRAIATSSVLFTFGIGAILGPNIGAALLKSYGWRMPFIAFGLSAIPILILIIFVTRSWFTEYSPAKQRDEQAASQASGAAAQPVDLGADRMTAPEPMMLALATAFAGLAIYAYLGLYPTFLREQVGFSAGNAGLAVSAYGLGAMVALIGGWMGDRFDYFKVLFGSLVVAGASGYFLFTKIESLGAQIALSFIFGASISGMVYGNLSAGIIKSMKRELAGKASGLFVASLYLPAAFAGLLMAKLAEALSWSAAGAIQITGLSLVAGILALFTRRVRKQQMART